MNFSIVIPSRKRLHLLKQLLKTIEDTTENLEQVEVFVAVDNDDSTVNDYAEYLRSIEKFKVHLIVQDHCDNINDGYYNRLARMSKARFVIAVNDDCVFGTKGWDRIIIEKVHAAGLDGKVAYLKLGGNGVASGDGSYSPFPGLSRQSIDVLGYFHWPGIWTWDADEVLWNAYAGLKNVYGYDRIVECLEVEIQHLNNENFKYASTSDAYEDSTNNMIRNYNNGDCGKDFHHYMTIIDNLKNGIEQQNA